MGYTWEEFKSNVKVMLTVDGDRVGAEEFVDKKIRLGVLDVQHVIKRYRTGHQDTYTSADVQQHRAASKVTLPEECQPRDCFVIRSKDDDEDLTGTVTLASASATIEGSATLFTEELKVGDQVKFSTMSTYVRVTEIASDTEMTVDSPVDAGDDQTIVKLIEYRHPCRPVGWRDRERLFTGESTLIDNNALMTISPDGILYVFPSIQSEDANGYTYAFELNWDGRKVDFEDEDVTPFDEALVDCVADYVKGECARHFDRDQERWSSFCRPSNPKLNDPGGTYHQKRQVLYLEKRDHTMLE
jgi:hypothetical protein